MERTWPVHLGPCLGQPDDAVEVISDGDVHATRQVPGLADPSVVHTTETT